MMRQRLVAFAMIAMEAALALRMLFQFEWFPVILIIVAAAGVPGLARIRLSAQGRLGAVVGIAALVSYGTQSGMLFSHRLPMLPILTGFTYPVGWCLLVIQVAILFLRTEDNRLPIYFPVYGATVMAYIGLLGQNSSHDPHHYFFHAASLAFVVLTILYWPVLRRRDPAPRSMRWRGALIQGAIVAVVLPASFVTSTVIGANRTEIDAAFVNLLGAMAPASKVGFSTKSRLDSVKRLQTEDGKKIALRVYAERAPGYMRGRAYDTYDGSQWTVTFQESPLPLAADPVAREVPKASGALFAVQNGKGPYASLTVLPASAFDGCLFAPLNAAFVRIAEASPVGDDDGNLKVNEVPARSDYQVVTATPSEVTLPKDALQRYTAPPTAVDPGVRHLAARLFEQCSTTKEKAAAVVRYFADNYTYQLGIQVPPGNDPITYFLLTQPPAHCEYFATGAALLLRLGGVPCRYVTGFVTEDYNDFGGYWVARNRNAHAWVEVYDDAQKSWLTVEPTVAAGVPSEDSDRSDGLLAQLKDFAGFLLQSIRTALATGNWAELVPALKSLRWTFVALCAGLLAVISVRALRRYAKNRRVAPRAILAPEALELQRLRRRMDRQMRRRGFVRRPQETVKAFADRIAAAATQAEPAIRESLRHATEWYEKYSEARFRGPLSPDILAELRRACGN